MVLPQLTNGSSVRGAQMGRPDRHTSDKTASIKFRFVRLRLVDGDYDQGGAYWGYTAGTAIYRAYAEHNGDVVEVFNRATSRQLAKDMIHADYPNARFYN
jgi:hypothetical protein